MAFHGLPWPSLSEIHGEMWAQIQKLRAKAATMLHVGRLSAPVGRVPELTWMPDGRRIALGDDAVFHPFPSFKLALDRSPFTTTRLLGASRSATALINLHQVCNLHGISAHLPFHGLPWPSMAFSDREAPLRAHQLALGCLRRGAWRWRDQLLCGREAGARARSRTRRRASLRRTRPRRRDRRQYDRGSHRGPIHSMPHTEPTTPEANLSTPRL